MVFREVLAYDVEIEPAGVTAIRSCRMNSDELDLFRLDVDAPRNVDVFVVNEREEIGARRYLRREPDLEAVRGLVQ